MRIVRVSRTSILPRLIITFLESHLLRIAVVFELQLSTMNLGDAWCLSQRHVPVLDFANFEIVGLMPSEGLKSSIIFLKQNEQSPLLEWTASLTESVTSKMQKHRAGLQLRKYVVVLRRCGLWDGLVLKDALNGDAACTIKNG